MRRPRSKTEINEHKPIEYRPRSKHVEAEIIEQSPSRAAQKDRVLHAQRGTPPRDANRK
jgi:hypothetical protein